MGGKSPAAPVPVDAAKASGEYLFGANFGQQYNGVTDPRLQNRLLSAEAQYRPQYAGLELQDINTYLLGSKEIKPYQTLQSVKTGGGEQVDIVAPPKKKGGFLGSMGISKYVDPTGIMGKLPGTPEYLLAKAEGRNMTASSTDGLVQRNGKWYTQDIYEDKMVDMPGMEAQKGVIDLTSIAAQKAAEIDRQSNTEQRKLDLAMLEQYGAQTTDAARASDPYSRAIAEAQQKFAEDAYRNSGVLGFEEQRAADQQARMMGQQAGRQGSNSVIGAQMLNRQNAIAQRGQMAQQAGQQSFAMNRQFGDPVQILLGRPGSSAGMGSQFFGQAAGLAQGPAGPQLFDPNAGVNLALQNSANKSQFDASIFGAKSAMKGAIIGGALSGIGGAAGGFCWVAREVYGVESPSWLLFREWLALKGPHWLFNLYMKHGEKFALWIANKPKLKKLIRWWMDGRIANHLSSK